MRGGGGNKALARGQWRLHPHDGAALHGRARMRARPFTPVAMFFALPAPPNPRAVLLHTMFCPGVERRGRAARARFLR
ncbi:hypothetical protein B0H10DRAFT_2222109 [Mycena sp. CBHHK59/15]|nr:hypothetical protein B0H10DRAFT_2222109 [Mycena sp. CBHHK59/15]